MMMVTKKMKIENIAMMTISSDLDYTIITLLIPKYKILPPFQKRSEVMGSLVGSLLSLLYVAP